MKTLYYRRTRQKINPDQSASTADVAFVTGGLKAALHSHNAVRKNVMSDVSRVLNCDPQELDFLFGETAATSNDNDVFDFPDSHRRRRVIRNNFLDAAE